MAELGVTPLEKDEDAILKKKYINTGEGLNLVPIDIKHHDYIGVIDPDTAFWALIDKKELGHAIYEESFIEQYRQKHDQLFEEMQTLRFRLKPSAVYFNPTERCNLNCKYCYIPENLRRSGVQMSRSKLLDALEILRDYFQEQLPEGRKAEIIFHGSEPMLNRDAIFEAIEKYKDVFNFGVQTNATLLDREGVEFLTSNNIGVGLSLDAHQAEICNKTRKTWSGKGIFEKVVKVIELLNGYYNFNVICTVNSGNVSYLTDIINFFHELEVPACMLNPIRCTQPGARTIKPFETIFAKHFVEALNTTFTLYQVTGRKLVVVNFANVMVSILAPLARKLMCDISPCGGGRSFFAVAADGGLYPCSEFIGLPEFKGGNIFRGELETALESDVFKKVTGRLVENIEPCKRCAIRHFCGSPCPAEAYSMNGNIDTRGAFCEFYEEQVRYAFRKIAEGQEEAFLWDNWDEDTDTILNITSF